MSAATAQQVQTADRFTGDRVPLQSDRALPREGLFRPAPRHAELRGVAGSGLFDLSPNSPSIKALGAPRLGRSFLR